VATEKIMLDWKKGIFKPVYWLEGEEPFFIDQVVDYAERKILSESEAGFNLSVFYGRDADWSDVVNACRRYPMFSERQVVVLKEAQFMRDVERLEGYVEFPLTSTVLVVGYKQKKVDGRSRFAKLLKQKGELLTTKKLFDNELPGWVAGYARSKGYTLSEKAIYLLVEHIGNDLSRIANELQKLESNLGDRKTITEDDVETFVGISKEYNAFELEHALTQRNMMRCLQIVQYLHANPKALPIQQLLPTLYGFFSKAYLVFGAVTNDEQQLAGYLGYKGLNPYVRDLINCARNYRQAGVEQALLLLHEYNLKSLGIGASGIDGAELLKEMIVKMITPAPEV
jgi:DNA polymerase-3 subunit delta